MMDDFADKEFIKGDYRVMWEWIGEGWSGDYDPDDPLDTRLLRFSCDKYVDGEWEQMDDASYCTALPINTPTEHLEIAADRIFDAIENASYKRELEYLSWFDPSDFS